MFVITTDLVNDTGEFIGVMSEDCPENLNLYDVSAIKDLMYCKFRVEDGIGNSMYEGFTSDDSFEAMLDILDSLKMSTWWLKRCGYKFIFED